MNSIDEIILRLRILYKKYKIHTYYIDLFTDYILENINKIQFDTNEIITYDADNQIIFSLNKDNNNSKILYEESYKDIFTYLLTSINYDYFYEICYLSNEIWDININQKINMDQSKYPQIISPIILKISLNIEPDIKMPELINYNSSLPIPQISHISDMLKLFF